MMKAQISTVYTGTDESILMVMAPVQISQIVPSINGGTRVSVTFAYNSMRQQRT